MPQIVEGNTQNKVFPGLERAPHRSNRINLLLAAGLVSIVFGVLFFRLFKLQVLEHDYYSGRVDRIVQVADNTRGHRGLIKTRDGTMLAVDVPRYTLAMDPGLPSRAPRGPEEAVDYHRIPDEYQEFVVNFIARKLSYSDVKRRKILNRLYKSKDAFLSGRSTPLRYLVLADRQEQEEVNALLDEMRETLRSASLEEGKSEDDIKELLRYFRVGKGGLCLTEVHHRVYPKKNALSHVIGTVMPGDREGDLRGLEGIERTLNSYLEGRDGRSQYFCDGLRKTWFYNPDNVAIASTDGYNVTLTIDSRIQKIVEEELAKGVKAKEAEAGVAVVMDCRNGEVLAMASYPDFDPARFHGYPPKELSERRRNRVIESQFEPGSTIKPLVAALALEKGVVRLEELIWKGGDVEKILGRTVRDAHDKGPLSFEDAVVHSSNIGLAKVGLRLAKPGLNELLDRFHFGVKTKIPLPGEAPGSRRKLSEWSEKYTSISVSFGYGLTVTPIQLASAYCALVNGGMYYRPRLILKVQREGEVHRVDPEPMGRVVSEGISEEMRRILNQVVIRGTGRWHQIKGFQYGAKTGTAIVSQGKKGYIGSEGKQYRSSFVAFAPYEEKKKPDIVVMVTIEKPNRRLGYYGSVVCGPVVKNVLRRIYRIPEEGLPEGSQLGRLTTAAVLPMNN